MGAQARAVIIGGGIMGCSLAYHLGRAGWRDVVLLEQYDLGDGTTWHSGGLVSMLRGTEAPADRASGGSREHSPAWHARLASYLPPLAGTLRSEIGRDAGWRPVGSLRLALSHGYVDELRRLARRADELGIPLELRGASATMSLAPRIDLSDVQAAAWLPGEGFLRPKDYVAALAAGALLHGVSIRTGVQVTGLDVVDGQIRGVRTDKGDISAPIVINAAGALADRIGTMAGINVPIVALAHQYGVTEVLDPPLDPDRTPVVRIPEQGFYLRAANGSVIVGATPAQPMLEKDPLATSRALLKPDDTAFSQVLELGRQRMPELSDVEIAKIVNGVEAFTPDGAPLLGPSTVSGLWIAAGFGLHGMALAGGAGRHLCEWIVSGAPAWDLGQLLPSRFGCGAESRDWVVSRAIESFRRYQ